MWKRTHERVVAAAEASAKAERKWWSTRVFYLIDHLKQAHFRVAMNQQTPDQRAALGVINAGLKIDRAHLATVPESARAGGADKRLLTEEFST